MFQAPGLPPSLEKNMDRRCSKGSWERGHHPILSLEDGEPKIVGCIECDWSLVVCDALDEELSESELWRGNRVADVNYEQRRCLAVTQKGTRCRLPVEDDSMCDRHRDMRVLWDRSYAAFRAPWYHRVSLPEAYRQVFIRAIRDADLVARDQQVPREIFERARELRQESVVYFVERDGLIKIGTTTNLRARLRSLGQGGCKMPEGMTVGPVTLLASTPGDRVDESQYHERFRKQRVGGEWFRPNKALLRVIEDLQRAERNGRKDILDEALEAA